MSKEEGGGRLLSKVARFVRNPLKDWSELDAADRAGQPSPVDSNGYSREALKELIERRQRNEFVRRREFDMLRKLRQREAAGVRDGSGSPSSFHLNTAGKTDGRALTLKKIDEIEEQMSQQWWKGRPSQAGTVEGAAAADPLAAQHARAYADTAPGEPPPDVLPAAPSAALPASRLQAATVVEEAALRFAEGDDGQAEALLLAAVAPDGAQAEDDDTWRALLDFYRASGDAEKFAAASMRYAQRFRKPGPEWVSLRALARRHDPPASQAAIDWYCPPQLGRDGLIELTQALSRAGAVWRLDWRALRGIDADAVAPLGTLFSHWADSPTQVRFCGAERLIAVLAEATPLTVRETDPAWWQVYLSVLRLMHLPDDFELVALNYCITYEALPPSWQEPVGSYGTVDGPAGGRAGGLQLASDAAGDAPDVQLSGEIQGASPSVWQRLAADLAEARAPAVSCAALVRLDLAATAGLLTWLEARGAQEPRVEFTDVHRLLLALFGLVGITEHASVLPRR
ncbi:STAS domain-containing protein [Xenophilus sp. Marseille-Q4582]|uniref:STAS domain-containing protein n=1 Tax=Xenophilus sp. Marseille-Q4582 TaxID=2866600 RepID=UPI001CE45F63|nr:STAS domain-containing protein [Xenophilus sp. Marseille-Q4582]